MAAMTDGTTRDHLVFSLDALLLRGIVRLLLDSAAAIVTGSAVVVARQLLRSGRFSKKSMSDSGGV